MLEEGLDVVALKKLDLPKKAAPDLKTGILLRRIKKNIL
jgi:CTP synthase